jgi:hypothetical protein
MERSIYSGRIDDSIDEEKRNKDKSLRLERENRFAAVHSVFGQDLF